MFDAVIDLCKDYQSMNSLETHSIIWIVATIIVVAVALMIAIRKSQRALANEFIAEVRQLSQITLSAIRNGKKKDDCPD